jgi:hypothetical protein
MAPPCPRTGNRVHRLIALLVLTSCPLALAHERSGGELAAEEAASEWSLGVGVELRSPRLLLVANPLAVPGLGGLGSLGVPSIPATPLVSLERRLDERHWLVLGLGASFSSSVTTPVEPMPLPLGEEAALRHRSGFVSGSVGIRRWLTSPSAPVLLSVVGSATVGYARALTHGVLFNGASLVPTSGGSWTAAAGLSGTFAAERFLTEHLTARLSAQVLQAQYSYFRASGPSFGTPRPSQTSGLSAGLGLEPALELRLYF